MPSAECILFATDFSPDAALALELASRHAAGLRADVVLLHVDAAPATAPLSPEARSRREASRRSLQEALEQLRAAGVSATAILRPGDPAREILRVAAAEGAHLIVIASHGWTRSPSLLLGSVADRVVRHSPRPVLLVRHPGRLPQDPPPADPTAGAGPAVAPLKRPNDAA